MAVPLPKAQAAAATERLPTSVQADKQVVTDVEETGERTQDKEEVEPSAPSARRGWWRRNNHMALGLVS
jgi:hypothetical protein